MSRELSVVLVQDPSVPSIDEFEQRVDALAESYPHGQLMVFPEAHLNRVSGVPRDRPLIERAHRLDGELCGRLAAIAKRRSMWLIPGSFLEVGADDRIYNTTVVLSPSGELVASYRKIMPWRPTETVEPGLDFVVFDIDNVGRLGLLICYDSWFPEISRQLAWMGAEILVCPVLTDTNDRPAELVMSQANAIVNQVFFASVNAATPTGMGRSMLVDPQGRIVEQAHGAESTVLSAVIDLDDVTRTRRYGTAGVSRPWSQFSRSDQVIPLPVYQGRIDPASWNPARGAEVDHG